MEAALGRNILNPGRESDVEDCLMMPLGSYLGFLAAVTALMILPGPNVALIVGTSLDRGLRSGLEVVAGTTAAMAVQLVAVTVGLATLMASASHLFEALRWIGVAYLAGLGLRALASRPEALRPQIRAEARGRAALRGFAVSSTNPKTLLFYGALLPQFVDPTRDLRTQSALLSATALAAAGTIDTLWALLATRLHGLLALRPAWRQRLSGGCLLGAAAGLALAHRRT